MATVAKTHPTLGTWDVAAMIVGVVVGAGIFRLPSAVAANTTGPAQMMSVWVIGGVVSLIGALCYAELCTTYPHRGGDYHYLHRAFGANVGYLFAWARIAVIQTGSITLQAFLIGDYMSQVRPLGSHSSAIYAALVVSMVTAVNAFGIRQGKTAQHALTGMTLLGLIALTIIGLGSPSAVSEPIAASGQGGSAIGLALVFALLAYGGWSEAAYLSAEVRNSRNDMVRALAIGIFTITGLYLLVNWALLRSLGFERMAASEAVAADMMRSRIGDSGATALSLLIALAALSTTNATVITGARSAYAFGKDHPLLGFLGTWRDDRGTPVNALIAQGLVALALVGVGSIATQDGFSTMVEYTAPVFWAFLLLVGLSLFVLRRKDPSALRPFRVPLYPFTPIVFCLASAAMLYSSLAYTRSGSLVGVAVLLAGVPLVLLGKSARDQDAVSDFVERRSEPAVPSQPHP